MAWLSSVRCARPARTSSSDPPTTRGYCSPPAGGATPPNVPTLNELDVDADGVGEVETRTDASSCEEPHTPLAARLHRRPQHLIMALIGVVLVAHDRAAAAAAPPSRQLNSP